MIPSTRQPLVTALLVTIILAQSLFAAFPGIDLWVSSLFAQGTSGFPWGHGTGPTVNLVVRRSGESILLLLVLWGVIGAATGLLRGDALRAWVFPPLSVALASGVIVNLFLKEHVGRARPADITAFGGTASFSPAWQVTDQCQTNCSFVSGEIALAASLVLSILVLLWPRLTEAKGRGLAVVAGGLYLGLVSVLRISLGRHFFSDAVFATLIAAVVVMGLYWLLGISRARQTFDPVLPLTLARSWRTKRRARLGQVVENRSENAD